LRQKGVHTTVDTIMEQVRRQQEGKSRRSKRPRYQAVTEALRQRISGGSLTPGIKLPTLRDLAAEFKVSTNTIRQAIRVLEHEGQVYHVRDVGAFVTPAVAPAAASRVRIAMATIDIGGPFELGIARGVEQACQERGWELMLFDARANAEIEFSNLVRLGESGTRGAIIMPISDNANLEALVRLKLSGYQMVLVDRGVPGLKVDVIESDHEKAAYQATEYLVKRGHRRIRILTWPPVATSIAARIRGFEGALMTAGIEPSRNNMLYIDPKVSVRGVQEGKRWLDGYEAVMPLLKNTPLPLALFALNDYAAWGVYQACRELGLRIPEDVSVVCVDDSEITRAVTPPITVVAQRPVQIGKRAVELLERRLANPDGQIEPVREVLEVDLIERQSVASLPETGCPSAGARRGVSQH
jgi:DNA-binding LacI/PurR family transcriptional regulator